MRERTRESDDRAYEARGRMRKGKGGKNWNDECAREKVRVIM